MHSINSSSFTVRSYRGSYRFARWFDLRPAERARAVGTAEALQALDSGLADAATNEGVLRMNRALRRESWLSRPKVRDALRRSIASGHLVALLTQHARAPFRPNEPVPIEEKSTETDPTWFEVRVVWDDTGEPVSGLGLVTDFGDGNTSMNETDSDGTIRHENVEKAVEVRCRIDGVTWEECAQFVSDSNQPPDPETKAKNRPSPSAIADVELHRVQTGETLESLATGIGLSWKKLAKFNFATDDPQKINDMMVKMIGCRKKTKDGKNYLFDSSDDPGVIFLPKMWKRSHLQVATHHVIRIRPLELPELRFRFSM